MESLEPQPVPPAVAVALPSASLRRVSIYRALGALAGLIFASAICVGMIWIRRYYVGYVSFAFLVWNLVLAWIPLVFATVTYCFFAVGERRRWLFGTSAFAWFVFFPNAPYMVTDFVHISPIHVFPEWLDIITVIACAWTGLCLGYASLYLMQEIARERYGKMAGWLFVLVMLAFGSVGVFCGRFLRWNSWDVLKKPFWMLRTAHTVHRFSAPGDLLFLWTLFMFLLLSYCVLFGLTHLYDDRKNEKLPATLDGPAPS